MKLLHIPLLICLLVVASCSSDDDGNDNQQEASILGTWNATQFTMEGTFTQEEVSVSFDGIADNLTGNDISFNENNTLNGNSAPFEMQLDYVINGENMSITQEVSSLTVIEGTWSREGDILYLQENGSSENVEYIIETLNATTLKLTADQNNINLEGDFPSDSEFEVSITYKR